MTNLWCKTSELAITLNNNTMFHKAVRYVVQNTASPRGESNDAGDIGLAEFSVKYFHQHAEIS